MVEIAKVPRGRAKQSALPMLLLVMGLWLMMASGAQAGEWTQVTCTQPNGQPAPTEGWTGTSVGGLAPYSSANNDCAQQGGYLIAANSAQVTVDRSTGPMWQYAAPAGSTIAGGSVAVSLTAPQGTAYLATPNNTYDGADVFANCQFNEPCGSGGSYSGVVPIDHPGGSSLYAAAMCVGPGQPETPTANCAAGDGANGLNAQTIVYAADIELANTSTPAATGFAGSLFAPGASGTADLTFSAQDSDGPGVYRVTVDVDNTAVYEGTPESNGGRCASIGTGPSGVGEFLYAQPCKQNVAVDVPVNTTKLTNGQHQLKVTVQDAAGNTSVVYDGTIAISNPSATASSGEITGGSSRGPVNGTNASEHATLTARWADTTKTSLRSAYQHRHPLVITGRLSGPGGAPIVGALIELTATPAYGGAQPITMPSPRTGPDGAFRVSLPGGLSSRTLRFAYRSHLNDKLPAATRTLTLDVRAALTLRIAPHVARAQGRIFFTGVLHGGPIPQAGKQLVLEAQSPSRGWLEFDVIRTGSHGRFHASYHFKYPGPATYRFRVLSKYEGDFPFVAGASNTVEVEER
jgi:hypothetical protein